MKRPLKQITWIRPNLDDASRNTVIGETLCLAHLIKVHDALDLLGLTGVISPPLAASTCGRCHAHSEGVAAEHYVTRMAVGATR